MPPEEKKISSPPPHPPFRKLLFFACFRFLIFHPFFQGGQLTPFAPMYGRPCRWVIPFQPSGKCTAVCIEAKSCRVCQLYASAFSVHVAGSRGTQCWLSAEFTIVLLLHALRSDAFYIPCMYRVGQKSAAADSSVITILLSNLSRFKNVFT